MPIEIDPRDRSHTHSLHILKCDQTPFGLVLRGEKPFEIRIDDRPYAAGDLLLLREVDDPVPPEDWTGPLHPRYTGRALFRRVTCAMRDCYGLLPGFCVMGIAPVEGVSGLLIVRSI